MQLKRLKKSEDFIIGKDNFSDLIINLSPSDDQFYYFYHKKEKRLIKQFILKVKRHVDYTCRVSLIKKEDKFTPRLFLAVRDKRKSIVNINKYSNKTIKASVSLEECHNEFWELISFLQTLRDIDVPKTPFSLVSQDEKAIVDALIKDKTPESVKNIIRELLKSPNITLTQKDINILLKRRDILRQFKRAIKDKDKGERNWWQDFFEKNKWIFGYGLNYEILKHEESQPNYGGAKLDGSGGQRGDYLMRTHGSLSFTVLVEIKTPQTPLLGSRKARNGAWELSKDLTNALVQLQANIQIWEKHGSEQPYNRDRLERRGIFTVKPKGIVVIGLLDQLIDDRDKRETFQRFRKSIHGIEIITFDELYNRAKFIVEND